MDQVYVIRHKVLVEGRSQRQVAKELGISRRTVRRYLETAVPVRREAAARLRPVWDAVGPRVEALLAESPEWTGGKQQLTATRLHELLVAEGHRVGVTLVKEAVAEWKRQRREVFVPLTYRPGDLAEVDFFEVLVDVDGTRRKAWLFLLRLMYSGRDFAWIYERQDQVSLTSSCSPPSNRTMNPTASQTSPHTVSVLDEAKRITPEGPSGCLYADETSWQARQAEPKDLKADTRGGIDHDTASFAVHAPALGHR